MKNGKNYLAGCLAALMCAFTACGGGGGTASESGGGGTASKATEANGTVIGEGVKDDKTDKGLEILGDTVKYDPNQPVNNGDPILVEFWYWNGGTTLFTKIAEEYTKVHPNVQISLVENPWDDYWTKLPLTLNSNSGPAIFNVHNSYHDNLINYMAPYDIPVADLQKDFIGVDAHIIDGNIYYIDYGIMTGSVYYNTKMWEAAGLTEADIPKTWDQLREVAKKLTIKDGDNFTQAGFNFNDSLRNYVIGLNYQWGENLFHEDGTANYCNESTIEIVQLFKDMYDVDGVGSVNFGNNSGECFGQGQAAMVPAWGNFTNTLKNDYPDIEYGVFEIPTPSTDVPYAYNRYNGESTFGVNKAASPEQQAIAQDIIKFFIANDSIQKEFNLSNSTYPAKHSLESDPDLLAVPAIACLADHSDRYIWPGPMPATIENNSKIAMQNIFNNGMAIEDALKQAENDMNTELANTNFVPVENLYKYAGEKK